LVPVALANLLAAPFFLVSWDVVRKLGEDLGLLVEGPNVLPAVPGVDQESLQGRFTEIPGHHHHHG
jgi:hypothetical protein